MFAPILKMDPLQAAKPRSGLTSLFML